MNRLTAVSIVTLASLIAAGCSQQPASKSAAAPVTKEDNVAVVDGHAISRNTYNQYVKGVAGKPAEDLTAEQRTQLLDNLIRGEVVATNAEKTGLAAQDQTRAVMELSRLTVLQQASSESYLKDRKTSDEEVRAEYDIQVTNMPRTQYQASHILVATKEEADKVLAALGKGTSFAELARRSSTDSASSKNGGNLDWFTPESMTPAFADAVKALKKGETTKTPVQTQFGWHVIRLTNTREATPPPFDSVRERLVQIVEAKKFKAYTDDLMAKAKIEKKL
jgi:peptidyl-prolyl cis-trans isomerase C